MALVAVAATGKLHMPDIRGDRTNFEKFLLCNPRWPFSRIGHVEYRGSMLPFTSVFYKVLRNNLIHEGDIPIDFEFEPQDGLSLRAGGAPNYKLQLSRGWYYALVNAVEETLSESECHPVDLA